VKRIPTLRFCLILLLAAAGVARAQSISWSFDTAAEDEASRSVQSSPCLADANGDGQQEIFFGSGGGTFYALYSNGQQWWSYPTDGVIFSSPAVGDINGDNRPEVVVGSDDGGVYAFRSSGGLLSGSWPVFTGGPVRGSALLADIDDNGTDDIVITSGDGKLYALDYQGYDLPGFPYKLGSASESSPTAADIDNDGMLEIVVGDNSGFVHAVNHDGTPLGGWEMPKSTGYSVKSSPALGDIDGDGFLEIVVGSEDFKVYAWKPNGLLMSGWPVPTEYNIFHSSPAIADVDGDSEVEVVIASGDGRVYALEANGRSVPGFPLVQPAVEGTTGSATIHGSVTLADMGSGLAAVVGAEDGKLYAWRVTDGQIHPGFPVPIANGAVRSTPAIGDLEGDGTTEIVAGNNDGNLACIEVGGSFDPDRAPWPMFLNNPTHVTLFGHGAVPEVAIEPIEGEQTGDVTISYQISDRQNDTVKLWVLYSDDSGSTYHEASVSGQTTGLGPADYTGSVVWHSRDDMDHIEETGVKIKLVAEDQTGMGLGIESGLVHLDNNDPPRAIIEPLEGEQTGDVYINYRLEDDESDELLVTCEYSIDGGETWMEALGAEGNLHHIDPVHYADQLIWDSRVDLEEQHVEGCLFAITPEDRDVGQRSVSAPFTVDNNPPPTMFVENVTGEQSDRIEINYEVTDTGDDEISLACFYSPNFGKDWFEATVEGPTTGIRMQEMAAYDWVGTGQLVWLSAADLPSVDRPEVQFRIIPSDLDEGEEDDTVPFRVDNNEPPTARVTDISTEVSGEVQLTFSIDDPENDTCDVLLEYSVDGGATWNPAYAKETVEPEGKETNLVRGFESSQPSHSITWLSTVDEDQLDTEQAMLRITARDNDLAASPAATVAFHLDNNETPTLTVDNITEESSGDIPIGYQLDDREQDVLSIACEFSADGGTTFQPATVSGATSGIGPAAYDGEIVWNSAADFDGRDEQNLVFRITVADNDTGDFSATAPFWVDNSVPPAVAITAITEEVSADVPIDYTLTDREGDPLSIVCEYSDDGGSTFQPATVTGQTEGIGSAGYDGIITWNSAADTTGVDQQDVFFRIRPFDNDEGESAQIGPLHVDNSFEPTVQITTTLEGEQTGDLAFAYQLNDQEQDTLSLTPEFSQDGGGFWQPATVSGQTDNLTPELYDGQLVWNSKTDLLGADLENVMFRLIPADNDAGEPAAVGPFHLDNNAVPAAELAQVTGEQSGDVVIGYNLTDDEGDITAILPEYSIDGGTTWNEATTKGLSTAAYSGELIWESVADIDGEDSEQVVFRITPEDNDVGEPGLTPAFHVDNNHVPVVNVADYTEEQTGDIEVVYNVNDREGDYVNLTAEYSLDGGATFKPATVTGALSEIGPTPYEGYFTWNSGADIQGLDSESVVFRVTPADNDTGESGQCAPFHVDNSTEPAVTLTAITEEQSGEVQIQYALTDVEGDPLSIIPEFSPDGGATWQPATVLGRVENINPELYSGSLTWQSAVDMDMVDNFDTHFRVRPFDNDEGESDQIGPFQVDNSDVPSVVVQTPEGEQTGDVTIAYQISDREGDPVSLTPEFSPDGGATWQPATVSGQTEGIGQSGYTGSLTWNSKLDLDQVDNFEVAFRLTPADNDTGEPYATDIFQVDNSDPPTITLAPITEEQTGYVTVDYLISDREGDPVKLTPEWSADGGTTWNRATVSQQVDIGSTGGIPPENYDGSLDWNSKTDTDFVDLPEVLFRLTPEDNDVGEPVTTGPFRLDNSDEPTIALVTPSGEQSADVVIDYEISDREGDPVTITPEFSRDAGTTWEPATVTGQTADIDSAGYLGSLTWNSKSDIDMLDLFEVQFRLTPADNDTGEPAATGTFQVDNSDPPTIVLSDITEEQSGDVTIAYEISDREGDPISLKPEFSTDGGAGFAPATTSGVLTEIGPGAYSGTLTWHSVSDMDGLDSTSVVFKLTPADNDQGTADETAPFQVDNSDAPSVSVVTPEGEQSGDVTIAYEISDREGDPVDLTPEFSRDGGATWEPATVTGQTAGIPETAYAGQLIWNSTSDIDMLDLFEVQFRLTPADNDTGEPDTTSSFQVDNSDIPAVSVVTPEGEQTADVTIAYEISDREGDPVSLKPEFSRDGGATWEPATVTGQTADIGPEGYSGTLTWNSKTDTDSYDLFEVVFKLTPSDNDEGTPDQTATFQVDNSDPPSISLTDITAEQTADVTIQYEISDREGDPVSITPEFSRDGGATWEPATVTGQTADIGPEVYSGTLTWNSKSDTDMLDLFEVRFRLTPADNDTGEPDATANFQVDNSDPPVAELGAVEAEVSGDIVIPYTLSDREGDPLSITCEYSLDGGTTWQPATVRNPTEDLGTPDYTGDIIWDSVTDLDGVDAADVVFRVTPADNDTGQAATVR
jgi:hypothetical protein